MFKSVFSEGALIIYGSSRPLELIDIILGYKPTFVRSTNSMGAITNFYIG